MSDPVKAPDALPLRMTKIMIGGAVFAATAYAIELGVAKAASTYLIPAVVIGLVCVVIGEILSWHNAAVAWHERRAGSMLLWGALACICSCGTLYTNFSTSALNQEEKSSIQQAAFNTYDDTAKTERELARHLDAIDAKLKLAPVETAEAYDSTIENLKAHRFWKLTDGCKATKGPQTRAFCSNYASAVANKANATESLTLKAERDQTATQLAQVRAERKVSKAVVSEDSPAILLLANWTGDKAEARQLDSMTFPLLVQAIMFLGGILLANEYARGMEKKPWIDWCRLGTAIHWVLAALTFKPLPQGGNRTINNVYTDRAFAESIVRNSKALGFKGALS